VHDLHFERKYEEFRPRTIWSLSNALTSAFKELDPIPQFKETSKLSEFLEPGFHRRCSPLGRSKPNQWTLSGRLLIQASKCFGEALRRMPTFRSRWKSPVAEAELYSNP
jgi:hypothetical protein